MSVIFIYEKENSILTVTYKPPNWLMPICPPKFPILSPNLLFSNQTYIIVLPCNNSRHLLTLSWLGHYTAPRWFVEFSRLVWFGPISWDILCHVWLCAADQQRAQRHGSHCSPKYQIQYNLFVSCIHNIYTDYNTQKWKTTAKYSISETVLCKTKDCSKFLNAHIHLITNIHLYLAYYMIHLFAYFLFYNFHIL
jgi:hypothetical protein